MASTDTEERKQRKKEREKRRKELKAQKKAEKKNGSISSKTADSPNTDATVNNSDGNVIKKLLNKINSLPLFRKIAIEKLFIICGCIMLAGSGIYTLVYYIIDSRSAKVWDEVRSHVAEAPPVAVTEPEEKNPSDDAVETKIEEETVPAYVSPYASLFDMNPNMVGWLKIPGTDVDYPIMFTPEDEDYYLNRNFYDERDHNGCLVLAAPNDIDKPSTNLLIHGHHMRSGAMFGNLADFKETDFRDSHNEIIMYTKDEERHYEVVGAMNARVLGSRESGFKYYGFFDGINQKHVNVYTDEANQYNLYEDKEINVDYWAGDELLTLSTCRGRSGGKDRFVLMCKRVASEITPREESDAVIEKPVEYTPPE